MNSTDRYLLLYLGEPIASSNDRVAIVLELWGREVRPGFYTILDYERPVAVLCPNLAHLDTALAEDGRHYDCPDCGTTVSGRARRWGGG